MIRVQGLLMRPSTSKPAWWLVTGVELGDRQGVVSGELHLRRHAVDQLPAAAGAPPLPPPPPPPGPWARYLTPIWPLCSCVVLCSRRWISLLHVGLCVQH